MTLVCGVDSSTQSCKVVIRDLSTGELVRSGRASHPDGTEVDPNVWWEAFQQALAAAGGLDGVQAISIAAQQHGMITLDRDGAVIRPALLWNDTRSATGAAQLTQEIGARELARRTGSVPVASFTLTKLRWLQDNEPEHAAHVAAVALPHDWLTWRLRGYGPADQSPLGPDLDALVTDRSDASGTCYFDPATDAYDLDLLERALGRNDVKLPQVLGPHQPAGRTEQNATSIAAGLVPPGILVGPGCGDNAGAALGLGAGPGDVVISIGTSGTVFAVTETPTSDPSGMIAGFADATGHFLPLVATLNAAHVLTTTAQMLGVDLEALDQLAINAQPGADGVVMVPYFQGERTPNLPHATASLHGLTIASSTPENIARAAHEGMLNALGVGLDALHTHDITEQRLLLIGGAAQSHALQTIAAQLFTAPIQIPATSEYVANGAATQAAWTLTGNQPHWPVELTAQPQPDHHPEIRHQYTRYAAAVAAAGL